MKKRYIFIALYIMLVIFCIPIEWHNSVQPMNMVVRGFIGSHLYRPIYPVMLFLHYFFGSVGASVQVAIWFGLFAVAFKKRREGLLLVGAEVMQSILIYFTKIIAHIGRPPQDYFGIFQKDWSYPSGHTAAAVTLAIMLTYFLHFKFKMKTGMLLSIIYWILALATSYSRLYLSVHWFIDIIGGWWMALIVTFIAIVLDKYFTLSEKKA